MCSLSIMIDSACSATLQLAPELSSAVDATVPPRPSATAEMSSMPGVPVSAPLPHGGLVGPYDVWQLPPCVVSSLWFHCDCGSNGGHGLPGWYSAAGR